VKGHGDGIEGRSGVVRQLPGGEPHAEEGRSIFDRDVRTLILLETSRIRALESPPNPDNLNQVGKELFERPEINEWDRLARITRPARYRKEPMLSVSREAVVGERRLKAPSLLLFAPLINKLMHGVK
jgi:hypothetical protein